MGGHVDYDAMEQRCREYLAQLDVQPPVPLSVLVEAVARVHGRPITLTPADLSVDSAFGATSGDARGDVIVYQRRTAASHQLVIVLHELAHILAGHKRRRIVPEIADVAERLNALPEGMLHLVLGSGAEGPSAVSDTLENARPGLLDELRDAARDPGAAPLRVESDEIAGASLYHEHDEWEAETMATIMLSWLTDRSLHPVSPTDERLRMTWGDL